MFCSIYNILKVTLEVVEGILVDCSTADTSY